MSDAYDLIVIGGGPGGYVAAIRAAQLGLRTALVEREHLGGICLNWGCIPTKALLRSADVWRTIQQAADFGIRVEGVSFDLDAIVERSRAVAERLRKGVAHLMRKHKVTVVEGHGRFAGLPARAAEHPLHTVQVQMADGAARALAAPNVILATGARPRPLPGIEPDGRRILTYREAMVPERLPQRLLIVGAGAIGVEFASFYRALGVAVILVEVAPRVLPVEDEEVSAFMTRALAQQGIEVLTEARLDEVVVSDAGVRARIAHGSEHRTVAVERMIVAAGIVGNVEALGLEHTRVQVEREHVVVDGWLATAEPGIHAIGDLAGPPWLAHKASHEAVTCVERIAGLPHAHPLDPRRVPGCTYSHPQVASVGLSEARARELGHEVRIGRFPFQANGKAIAMGDTEGFVKTVFDGRTGALLGAHLVGAEVTEMIQGYALAMELESTELELMRTVFPHPTQSEAMHEAVLDAWGQALHI